MMHGQLTNLGERAFANYGEWTDRIAKGELPFAKPARPQGVERNIVVTLRDWMDDKHYLHDLISSDRRHPTVNAYGPLFGSPEYSSDLLPILDPVKNVATTFKAPVRDPQMPLNLGPGHAAGLDPTMPSPYWGNERIWETRGQQPQLDVRPRRPAVAGRVGARRRQPGVVQGGLYPPVGQGVPDGPRRPASRRARPEDDEVQLRRDLLLDPPSAVRLRRERHAVDERRRPGGGVAGHEEVRLATGDAAASQGWTALVLDTNGNGKRDDYVEPDQPIDPAKDKRINSPFYAVMPNPADGSIWGATLGVPGAVVRLMPGPNPPADGARRGLHRARAGFRRARRRHRQQGRGVGVARQRPHGQLRSAQVQGAAERSRRRPATIAPRAGRSTSIPDPGSRASATTAPSPAITRGSTSTTRSASARTCRCPPAISTTG